MAARNFNTQLAGQIGESLVVSELGRKGFVATAFSGNVPDIDLLAYKHGKTLHLQVKAWRSGTVSFDATRFLNIRMEEDKQIVEGFVDSLDEKLIYVFVNIGEKAGDDKFFILDELRLAGLVRQGYESFLSKHDGVRPRNAKTTHNSVTLEQLSAFSENWNLIDEQLAK